MQKTTPDKQQPFLSTNSIVFCFTGISKIAHQFHIHLQHLKVQVKLETKLIKFDVTDLYQVLSKYFVFV
jgi:hypothetical protein